MQGMQISMKKLINIFESKRNILAIALLGGLVFNTYKIQENSNYIKKMNTVDNGIQTCFTRVNQTFTANLLKQTSSSYLTQGFKALTEECFAEAVNSIEELTTLQAADLQKKISGLSSNVHWFHEDLLANGNGKISKEDGPRNVAKRFSEIENTKNLVLEANQQLKEKLSNELNTQKNIFFAVAAMLFMILLAEIVSIAKRRLANFNSEFLADSELKDEGGIHSAKVGEIIRVALEQNELENCSKLFTNYYNYNQGIKAFSNKSSTSLANALIVPIKGNVEGEEVSKVLDQAWENDSIAKNADIESIKIVANSENVEESNIEQITSKMIDILAEKLFSFGIKVSTNVPEGLSVKGNSEEIEQSLYNLYNYSIEQAKEVKGERLLTINSHKLGDVVIYDISFSSKGFKLDPLQGKDSLGLIASEDNIDLLISKQIFEDAGIKVQLDNNISQSGIVDSSKMKLIFKAGTLVTKGRLVEIKKGKKGDILSTLKASESTL